MKKTKEEAALTRRRIIDAARDVFFQHGVIRSSLEKIACAAGLSRGAVYWHFENKAELFFAVRQDVLDNMLTPVDDILMSPGFSNPLDAIEASLKEFFRVIVETKEVRELFEIMISRCEFVDEFAGVQDEVQRPALEFLAKMQKVYEQADDKDCLTKCFKPVEAALDTWAFTSGLLYLLVRGQLGLNQVSSMIHSHMKSRRESFASVVSEYAV